MKKKLSILDIATSLNISPTTISFILNGKAKEKRISDQLVKKVERYIEEVGYRPNSLARSLRTGKSNIIGLMVESISNPFFASIARLIENKAYDNGYKIIYSSTDNDTTRTRELIRMYSERHVDGYIISPPEGIEEDIRSLVNAGIPVVFFDRYLPGLEVDSVTIENLESTYSAVKDLVSSGRKNIAFITVDSIQTQMKDRLAGYQKAMKEHGLGEHVKVVSFNQTPEDIITHLTKFFRKEKNLDSIIFSTNYLGISGLKTLRNLGLNIPGQISIIAFDDHDLFELHNPSITAISQPVEEIADAVINLLLDKLEKNARPGTHQQLVLPAHLVVRDSSKGVKRS